MNNKHNIIIIPVDNRPVSYTLLETISLLNKNINVLLPPREILGGLSTSAVVGGIFNWLEKVAARKKIDFIICALDTIAYGGLIPSRWCNDTEEEVLSRLERLKKLIQTVNSRVLGFSSILRISDSNVNEEEKQYWDKYGKLIFEFSCLSHKQELEPENKQVKERVQEIRRQIPPQVIDDYLKTRQRNFSINKTYLKWLEQGVLDFLILGKDDTAPVGLNIKEAEALQAEIADKNLNAMLHTGSDEISSLLLARVLKEIYNREILVYPIYSTPDGSGIIPRYEDQPLHQSVKNHLKVCNLQLAGSRTDADMLLLLHTPERVQNDFALGKMTEPENIQAVNFCTDFIKNSDKPVILADICCANGSDKILIEKIIEENINLNKLYGYAGWNTASNSLGCALSIGITRYIAEKQDSFSIENFNRLMFVRFADDWGYQSIARQNIRNTADEADEVLLYREFIPLVEKIAPKFGVDPDKIILSFPWARTFEVEINFL